MLGSVRTGCRVTATKQGETPSEQVGDHSAALDRGGEPRVPLEKHGRPFPLEIPGPEAEVSDSRDQRVEVPMETSTEGRGKESGKDCEGQMSTQTQIWASRVRRGDWVTGV